MKKPSRVMPRLEALEDRTVPATYRLIGGSLYITNQTGALSITSTGGSSVSVQDGAGPVLNFSGLGTVNVTGSNLGQDVTFDTTTTFNGNFYINSGNGNDTITVSGGAILGNLTILTGLGNDSVTINAAGNTVAGNVSFNDTTGNDTLNLNGNILGTITATRANTVNIGGGAAFNLGGNASFTNTGDGFAVVITIDGGGAGVFGKNLTVTAGSTADTVDFDSADTVGGITNINLGSGANELNLDGAANFDGNFTYTGGAGVDDFDVNDAATFNGTATLNMGDGDNTYDFASAAFAVAGNMNINAGNGNNAIGIFAGSVVAGNLNLKLGNGTNSFTLGDGANGSVAGDLYFNLGSGDNTLADDAAAFIGGRLRIRTLNGNNSYTANMGGVYNLDVLFGNGDDTFTYAGAGASLTGSLNGGGRLTANEFNQGAATLDPMLVLSNFP